MRRERKAAAQNRPYIELLRDPRWQRKRLEILERDGWECLNCGAADKTLNVHHRRYDRGKAPWEYEDENFETLCEDCHRKATEVTRRLKLALSGLCSSDLLEVLGYVQGMQLRRCEGTDTRLESYEHAMGIGAAYGFTAEQVMDLAKDNVITQDAITGAEIDKAQRSGG